MPGGVPEWSKGTDCKSVASGFGGSNPPPSSNLLYYNKLYDYHPIILNFRRGEFSLGFFLDYIICSCNEKIMILISEFRLLRR